MDKKLATLLAMCGDLPTAYMLYKAGGGSGTGQASGPIATFETTKSANLKALSVAIEPVQDLHGYDNPWPAGGGRNKFNPEEAQDNRWIDTSTGAIEPCSGYWVTGFIPVKAGDVIRCEAKGSSRNAWYNADKSDATYFAFSGGNGSATAPADGFVVFTVFGNTISFGADFIVTVNDSDITFAPYSNICPISGWTEVKVYRSGADTSDPAEYTVTLPSDPGTVYGGTLDVLSGVLTVDRAYVELTKNSNWFWNAQNTLAICSIANAVITNASSQYTVLVKNNMFKDSSWAGRSGSEYTCGIFYGASYVFVRSKDHIASIDDLKAVLGDNVLQVVYKIATPLTYNLTQTQIKTLVGTNNVWSDAGDVDVTYRR